MQQTRKIKNRNVECVDPMGPQLSDPCHSWQTPSSHQLPMGPCMNNCGTKYRIMLSTFKLNSSDFQVLRGRYLLLPLQEKVTPALFKNVMYFFILLCTVEESRSLPLCIWWVRLKERFANKIFGVDDTHCGWDRE
jgi:hypothetical protein